jgi:hypothetical protein
MKDFSNLSEHLTDKLTQGLDTTESANKKRRPREETQRVNIALTKENYEFLKSCSGLLYGARNMSHLVNILVEKFRQEKADAFERAKALREEVES